MNPKVRICSECMKQKANCGCEKLKPLTKEQSWAIMRDTYRRQHPEEFPDD